MRLDPKEARLIAELRGTPTGKVTAVKFNGEIKAIKTEIDAELSDKARGLAQPWNENVYRGTIPGELTPDEKSVKLSEPVKKAADLENIGEVRTEEPRR